ncbi:UxaA family hydrolase [Candidatus Halobonum tyrrellensis]|uniref:Dehydratase n=1 Tax=Candidatus Halobonum tyrrellensis G22 TaxID=1324957 RepID=V4HGN4_9EURY|nr:UxaA family hydrolase [Candidatus Halobonum tyrrellensis]ESP86969.1 dehydratase [Candidatus Halobonum tyrrellensis G22]
MKGVVVGGVGLVLDADDTVATALEDAPAGTELDYDGRTVTLAEEVPFGHKFALEPHAAGATVYKYGEAIGRVTRDVGAGEWVHTHNCESARGRGDVAAATANGDGANGNESSGTEAQR